MSEPTEIWHLDTAHVGRRVLVFDATGSTNDVAAGLGADRANDGVVVLAHTQTSGRGQHGRRWLARPGDGLTLSVLVFPPERVRRPAIVTAWAAVSVSRVVADVLGERPTLKWPNDVLFRGKKVCGILAEQGRGTVVGIGLNLNQTAGRFAEAGLPDAGSLAMFAPGGPPFPAEDAARALVRHLDAEYQQLIEFGTLPLEEEWRAGVGLLGRPVVAELCDGGRVGGVLTGLDFSEVRLESAGAVRSLSPELVRHLWGDPTSGVGRS